MNFLLDRGYLSRADYSTIKITSPDGASKEAIQYIRQNKVVDSIKKMQA